MASNNKTLVLIAIIFSFTIVIYAFLNYRGKLATIEYDKQKSREIETKISNCIGSAGNSYGVLWESECSSRGLGEHCSLPPNIADNLNNRLKEMEESCLKMFR